jgi:hypothetical protein
MECAFEIFNIKSEENIFLKRNEIKKSAQKTTVLFHNKWCNKSNNLFYSSQKIKTLDT